MQDADIASVLGTMGDDVADPKEGKIYDLSQEEEKELRRTLQIQADQDWKKRYEDLFIEYHDVCSKNKFDLGRATVVRHRIVMEDPQPVHARQFRVPFEHEELLHSYVEELLKQGAIEVSRSPYNSAIFCVPKKLPQGAPPGIKPPLRVVLDYRAVNAKSLSDRYLSLIHI